MREKQCINQPIMMQESNHRRDRAKVSSPRRQKPSALLPMKEWEEQRKQNHQKIHQHKVIKAKAVVDTKAPEMPTYIRDNRKKVQLQKEKKISLENQLLHQRVVKLISDFRREVWEAEWEKVQQLRDHCSWLPPVKTNKQVSSPRKQKPSTLQTMKEWEEQRLQNHQKIHRLKVREAKAVVDTKGPEMPAYKKKVQLQKEKKISLENKLLHQRIQKVESNFRREVWEAEWKKVQQLRDQCSRLPPVKTNKQVSSSTKQKPSALLTMKEWEEQRLQNHQKIHQHKVREAKAVVDTKAPEMPAYKKKVQMRTVDAAEGRKRVIRDKAYKGSPYWQPILISCC